MARPRIIAKHLRRTIREACVAAKNGHREICGLLVDNGCFFEFIAIRNRARKEGRFVFDAPQVRATQQAVRRLNRRIVGTYHSHPAATAQPGPGDIAGAVDGDLMLLIDCIEREAKLWRIGANRASAVQFDVVDL